MPSVDQLFGSATRFHQSGQLADAERYYRQILAQSPDHPDALHLLGLINLQIGRQVAAIDLMRQAINARPEFPEAYSNLAIAYQQVGNPAEAVMALKKSIAIKENNPQAHSNLGILLISMDKTRRSDCRRFSGALALARPTIPKAATNNLGKTRLCERREILRGATEAFRRCRRCGSHKPR